ncbi:MAG: MGDG synthase family glycosyltransferase [Bacillota bacterium]
MQESRRNIVILSVSAGAGHMRAAAALQSAFREDDPEREVIILDTFKYTSPLLERLILGAYMEMLRLTPAVYGYIYSRSEKGQPLSGYAKAEFNKLLSKFSAAKLLKFMGRHNPEAVVCTHPFPLGVLAAIRREGKFNHLTVGTITDFIIHPYWIFPEVDLYLVGAERLAGDLIGFGIPTARVHATGIPIDPAFAAPADPKEVRAGYNLDPGQTTILVMGGGLGLGPLAESVEALGGLDRRCQLIVVTGNNTQLKEKIERMIPGLPNRVCVLGYVDDVHKIMFASDIMVSKAGGLSCAEALAAGLPLFIMDPLPGQEERNSQFLTSTGAAVAVAGVHELVEKIIQCLEHPARLKEMSAAASRMGRPEAARDAVRAIKNFREDYYAG